MPLTEHQRCPICESDRDCCAEDRRLIRDIQRLMLEAEDRAQKSGRELHLMVGVECPLFRGAHPHPQ